MDTAGFRGVDSRTMTATQTEHMIEELAFHDPLTGLGNSRFVMTELEQRLSGQENADVPCSLMLLDVDGISMINDSIGYFAGDELLREIARRLRRIVADDLIIARVGSDEFAVVLEGMAHPDSTRAAAERVRRAMRDPMIIAGTVAKPSVSVGVAASPAPDAVTLWRNADVALREAKRLGGNRCELFDDSLHDGRAARLQLARDLRTATREHQLQVYYQPLVSACGHITGAEALLRWFHPSRGAVSPAEFIPIAEDTDLITEIETFVLDTSLDDLCSWWHTGRTDLTVHVNLSAKNLDDPTLVATVETLVAQHAVPASELCLEITETTPISDLGAASVTIAALDDLGVQLALDDFGTGYSSLIHLRQLPIHTLKLDRTFISGIDANAGDAVIVHSMIDLAHTLGLQTVAEGVETGHQACELWDMGCDQAQGFHWWDPLESTCRHASLSIL